MANYIWTNDAGEVVKQAPKSRGRVRTGAVLKEDGNWYIPASLLVDETQPEAFQAVTENTNTESNTSEAEAVEAEVPAFGNSGKAAKIIINQTPVELDVILKSIFRNPKDEKRENNEIEMLRVVISHESNVTGLQMNAVYSRIVIKADNSIHIWSNPHGEATYIIKNAVKAA